MKRILTTAVVVASFLALPASAQSNASAGSNSVSQTQSQSSALGGSVYLDQSTPAKRTVTTNNKQSGTATLKTAPSLGSLALGGGHPCAYSPATFQVSVIGGGGGLGGMKIDEACMARIAAAATGDVRYQNAANIIVAGRNPAACAAYQQAGLVASCPGRSILGTSASTQPAAATTVAYSKCDYDKAANKITFRAKGGANSATAKSQCMASLGF